MQHCPACGRPLAPDLVVTGRVRRRLVAIIADRPDGITRCELLNVLYANEENGGPEYASGIAVMVHHANR